MTTLTSTQPTVNLDLNLIGSASTMSQLTQYRAEYHAHRSLRDNLSTELEMRQPEGELAGRLAWIKGQNAHAAKLLKGTTGVNAFIACDAAVTSHMWDEAIELAAAANAEGTDINVLKIEALIGQNKIDDAAALANSVPTTSSLGLYVQALVAEARHENVPALELYERALESGDDRRILFRAAVLHDRHGNDNRAIELYSRCREQMPVILGCLINLGILYEDSGRLQDAVYCFEEILVVDPTNIRAKMYLRDVNASFNMTYDEEAERLRDQQLKLLQTKIADFELSVRSRNCLQMMNIHTLGDLVQKSEQELLSYPNFGETSLQEIKEILKAKNIRLGQSLTPGSMAQTIQGHIDTPETEHEDPVLKTPITSLKLSIRSQKVLEHLGVNCIGDIVQFTEEQLLAQKNFGKTSIKEIKGKLQEYNLDLAANDKRRSASL